ncbi:hypothetical protein HDU83_000569 [Entophlyctis luteolus]|nr:hypothetical protein HDU83_000569 [Entophlyctis luteolus]
MKRTAPAAQDAAEKRPRVGPAATAAAAAAASSGAGGIPDKDKARLLVFGSLYVLIVERPNQIAALIAEKRREIAAKMAMMAPAAVLPAQSAAGQAPSTSATAQTAMTDMQRRMAEVQARIKATMASPNIPAAIADPTKRGLKMDVHPLFDKAGAVDVDAIRSMFPKQNFSTVKANQRVAAAAVAAATAKGKGKTAASASTAPPLKEEEPKQEEKKQLELIEPPQDLFDPLKNPYFDPKIHSKVSMPKTRMAHKSFKFVQQGKFVDMANKMRQQAMLEKLKADIAANVKKAGMTVELDLVSDLCVRREPPPAVEWWDAPLLGPDAPYEVFSLDSAHVQAQVTNLLQHPIPIQPPAELGPPPPKPLMLTKREQKKLRRQKRLEAQKEKQDKIRIGLLPPDQPKVKISNLMRVLGTEAVQDPTKIEAVVRQQMRARQLQHQKYIAEHKLTKEQRRERTRLKYIENTHVIVEAAVFKINRLDKPQHRFKVEVNATQLFLSGVALLYSGSNLVIVEGGNRGIKQYKKLMLRRIDWSETADDEDDEDNEEKELPEEAPNSCVMIWEGKVKKRMFTGFKVVQCATERDVKDALERAGASHYWDAAKHFSVAAL